MKAAGEILAFMILLGGIIIYHNYWGVVYIISAFVFFLILYYIDDASGKEIKRLSKVLKNKDDEIELINQENHRLNNEIINSRKNATEAFKSILEDYLNPMLGATTTFKYQQQITLAEAFSQLSYKYNSMFQLIQKTYIGWFDRINTESKDITKLQIELHTFISDIEEKAKQCYAERNSWNSKIDSTKMIELLNKYRSFIDKLESFYHDNIGKKYGYNYLDFYLNFLNWILEQKENHL